MVSLSKENANHDATELKYHEMARNTKKNEYFKNGIWLFFEIKNFLACTSDGTLWKFILLRR